MPDADADELKSLIYENINRWNIYIDQEIEKEKEKNEEEKKN